MGRFIRASADSQVRILTFLDGATILQLQASCRLLQDVAEGANSIWNHLLQLNWPSFMVLRSACLVRGSLRSLYVRHHRLISSTYVSNLKQVESVRDAAGYSVLVELRCRERRVFSGMLDVCLEEPGAACVYLDLRPSKAKLQLTDAAFQRIQDAFRLSLTVLRRHDCKFSTLCTNAMVATGEVIGNQCFFNFRRPSMKLQSNILRAVLKQAQAEFQVKIELVGTILDMEHVDEDLDFETIDHEDVLYKFEVQKRACFLHFEGIIVELGLPCEPNNCNFQHKLDNLNVLSILEEFGQWI